LLVVPLVVPFTCIVAKGKGCPVSSKVRPEMDWENTRVLISRKNRLAIRGRSGRLVVKQVMDLVASGLPSENEISFGANYESMSKQVAIITGGSSGIGRALVHKYASEGYAVVFTGRDEGRMSEVEQELKQKGVDFLGLRLDAAGEENNRKLIESTVEKFGRIDVLICNAGISMRALFEKLEPGVFEKVMDINFYGTLYATRYALPHLLQSKGSIIGISSINGWRGTPARTAYSASKYAVQGFFEALRTEIMYRGVHVLVVCPGFTGTNIRNQALSADGSAQGDSPRDEKKMMTAEEVADHTFKAMKKRKRDLVLTFQGKMAVFLNKWMPARMDKIVYNVMAKEPDSPLVK
jgi:dehydrogenase/reductase SDR family member 7B